MLHHMKTITYILLVALSLLIVEKIIPGIEVSSLYTAIIAALVLGLLNVFVRPLLVILTLPITILTLGLFILVINAMLFIFAASFIDGFRVDGFLPALLGSLALSLMSAIGNTLLLKD